MERQQIFLTDFIPDLERKKKKKKKKEEESFTRLQNV